MGRVWSSAVSTGTLRLNALGSEPKAMTEYTNVSDVFKALGTHAALADKGGLDVTSPHDGEVIASLVADTQETTARKITIAKKAQAAWATVPRVKREALLEKFAQTLKDEAEKLAAFVHMEAGKTPTEANGEVAASAGVIGKTLKDATLADAGNMSRRKERLPVGVVGLITSFNFPIAVAHWTMAPAMLAGNGVVWKPSEKTPLVALGVKTVFDKAMGEHKDLLQVVIGGREVGEALVADEQVDMISATGSVAMGQAIEKTLATKKNKNIPPILELGGNNGVIISDNISKEHLGFALDAVMGSYLGTTGQRCTNTRRIIVHKKLLDDTVAGFKQRIQDFMDEHIAHATVHSANPYGYGPLIDEDSFKRFEHAKEQVGREGGEILFGKRLFAERLPGAFYVQPALAVMPQQGDIMYTETFAPILYIAPYEGKIENAIALVNAPENAGLVAGIYTQNQQEADVFATSVQAGHALINPPKGTGTPAHDMGFGGNKHSGCGEILNAADPLAAFTRRDHFTRIAQNTDIKMDQ